MKYRCPKCKSRRTFNRFPENIVTCLECKHRFEDYEGVDFVYTNGSDDYHKARELGLTNIDRWKTRSEHHKKSERLYNFIAKHDYNDHDDFFCFKSGGDGDNGEQLMYLLDCYFELLEIEENE